MDDGTPNLSTLIEQAAEDLNRPNLVAAWNPFMYTSHGSTGDAELLSHCSFFAAQVKEAVDACTTTNFVIVGIIQLPQSLFPDTQHPTICSTYISNDLSSLPRQEESIDFRLDRACAVLLPHVGPKVMTLTGNARRYGYVDHVLNTLVYETAHAKLADRDITSQSLETEGFLRDIFYPFKGITVFAELLESDVVKIYGVLPLGIRDGYTQ